MSTAPTDITKTPAVPEGNGAPAGPTVPNNAGSAGKPGGDPEPEPVSRYITSPRRKLIASQGSGTGDKVCCTGHESSIINVA